MRVVSAVAALFLAMPAVSAHAQGAINPACEKLLPTADVAKAAGLPGVTLIPYNPRKAVGGTCNYAAGDNMVLLVNLEQSATPESFQKYKKHDAYKHNQKDIPGLGDETFSMNADRPISVFPFLAMTMLSPVLREYENARKKT